MKVKALLNYYDKELQKDITKGEEFEVVDENRLKVLKGDNANKITFVEVIEDTKEKSSKDKKNAKTK